METNELGQAIRTLRLQREMTGTELAKRCGVTKSLISQIERGITVPSLDVLVRISNVLEVTVGQLIDVHHSTPGQHLSSVSELPYNPIIRSSERKQVAFPKENQVYEFLSPTLTGRIEFSILKIGPTDTTKGLTYTHPGEECLLVLEGNLTVILGDEEYHLQEGDSMTYPSTIPHSYRCDGSEQAVLVMAETPPVFLSVITQHTTSDSKNVDD